MIPHLETRKEYNRREGLWLEAGAPEGKEPWRELEFRNRNDFQPHWEVFSSSNPSWHACCDYRWKPRRISVTLMNGEEVSWPEPMREAPGMQSRYYWASTDDDIVYGATWYDSNLDKCRLVRNLCHLTKAAAQEHLEAQRKINAQGITA